MTAVNLDRLRALSAPGPLAMSLAEVEELRALAAAAADRIAKLELELEDVRDELRHTEGLLQEERMGSEL